MTPLLRLHRGQMADDFLIILLIGLKARHLGAYIVRLGFSFLI